MFRFLRLGFVTALATSLSACAGAGSSPYSGQISRTLSFEQRQAGGLGSSAADPVHHLFLVAQLNSTLSPNGGSTVLVYNEHGKLVEYINGFSFLNADTVIIPHLAVNPSKRLGYVHGSWPSFNDLQEFTY